MKYSLAMRVCKGLIYNHRIEVTEGKKMCVLCVFILT